MMYLRRSLSSSCSTALRRRATRLCSSAGVLTSSSSSSSSSSCTFTPRRCYISPPPKMKWQYLRMDFAVEEIRGNLADANQNMIIFESYKADEDVKSHAAIKNYVTQHDLVMQLRVKNSEFRRALLETELQSVVPAFQSMNGVVYPKDNDQFLALLKLFNTANILVVAAVAQGKAVHPLDLEGLTDFKSFNDMLATMVGTMNSQGNQLITALSSNSNQLIRTLNFRANQTEDTSDTSST